MSPDPNLNLFATDRDAIRAPQQDAFLKYVAPIYRRACKERKKELFFNLLFPVWFDRFPVILLDNFDADEGRGEHYVNPERLKFHMEAQKKKVRQMFFFLGAFHGGASDSDEYKKWEDLLTVDADRARRREHYFSHVSYGLYGQGHAFDVVLTPEERDQRTAALALPLEERHERGIQALCDAVEKSLWPWEKFWAMSDS
ncbi:hypothetical protein FPV67DRAFT_1670200 [Lyophyllum atratum]|nr:hypothetical protein FPV67DRAFT_1670200 [Lyophyllum atratum]